MSLALSSRAWRGGGPQLIMADSPTAPSRARAPQRAVRHTGEGRRWWVRYGIVFVFAVLLVNAVAGEKGYLELRRSQQRKAEVEAALVARRAENAVLQSRIQRMRTDRAAIEESVRQQLGYAKPGELVFTVREPRPQAPAKPSAGSTTSSAPAR